MPLRTTLLRCFSRGSPRLFPPPRFAAALFWRTRGGVCVGGWVSPGAVLPLWCAVSPLVVFPPAVCGGCAPLRSFDPARSFAFMGPPGGPSGIAMPDSGWQQSGRRGRAATARISTSAETPAGTKTSPRQFVNRILISFSPPHSSRATSPTISPTIALVFNYVIKKKSTADCF